jgi:tripeptide aminopeptidase
MGSGAIFAQRRGKALVRNLLRKIAPDPLVIHFGGQMMKIVGNIIAAICFSAGPVHAQTSDALVQAIIKSPKFDKATAFIDADHDRFVRELIALTEIPAPPFKEERRAKAYLEMLREAGLSDVEQDEEGNVMGIRKGTGSGPLLAVLAHLDTVFPEGTDVTIKRDGTKLMAPGVGDDTYGLALMLAVIRAMNAAKFETASDILFVGNVGEEGEGDLRGVKYLIEQGRYKGHIELFLSIDGLGQDRIVNGGLGSRRYRVTFKGPGGHSYNAFGLVSPSFAMGDAIQKLARVDVPKAPKTTFNVGVVGGGTSVNSIPYETYMDVDMRSESRGELDRLTNTFMRLINEAVDAENKARSTTEGKLSADIKLLGDRPSGETSVESPFTQTVSAAVKAFGLKPSYATASTDSNIPISHGIPALTIGRGGKGGRGHSLDEWVDVEKKSSVEGVQVALAVLLGVARGR